MFTRMIELQPCSAEENDRNDFKKEPYLLSTYLTKGGGEA